jgi:hypothetical protein
MTIQQFAEKYRVQTYRDECGETIVRGTQWVAPRNGHQIYEHDDSRFALLLAFEVEIGSGKSAKWVNARKKLQSAGFTLKQDGDAEGVALFDPENKAQARLALKLAGIRTRQISPERRAALAAQLAEARGKRAA